jgi:aspartyl-tRNA(Asn)/glutamyl-tRNA(Gln) amidotransferase subunit A
VSELWDRSLRELVDLVSRGDVSCREVVSSCLERIETVDLTVGAFVGLRKEEALREAEEADRARAAGAVRGPLHGLPVGVKSIFCSPDLETTCCSRILEGFRAPFEATALRGLRDAGMVVVGTTNMDEFAMGSSTENSALKVTRNPWDLGRIPGGSSGGSVAAVASREVPVALGSDTGGSIRQPAALCGVVGLKPTYGRVSRYGLVAFASSLDQIGPIGRTVEDVALVLGPIAGHDPRDSTSIPAPVPDYPQALGGGIRDLRIGLPREYFVEEGADTESLERVQEAVRVLEGLGAKTCEVSLPHTGYGVAAYYLICTAEASSNLSRYDGVKYGLRVDADDLDEMYRLTRSQGFGREVKRRIMLGTFVLSAGYYDAHPPGLRASLRGVRPAPHANDPGARVEARRAPRGSAGDVPGGRVHGHGEPGRASGTRGSVRLRRGGASGRAPADRQAPRRGHASSCRSHLPAGDRVAPQASRTVSGRASHP